MKIALIRVYANSGEGYDCYLDYDYICTSLPEWLEVSESDFDVLLKAKNSGRLLKNGYMLLVHESKDSVQDFIKNLKVEIQDEEIRAKEKAAKLKELTAQNKAKKAEKERTKELKQLEELKKELECL